jgi:hypothetical protein
LLLYGFRLAARVRGEPSRVTGGDRVTSRDWANEAAKKTALSVAQLISESEAYVSGTFQDYLHESGRPVPAWAWINGLAHGDPSEIRRIAGCPDPSGGPQAVVAHIAGQVLTRVERGPETLEALQHRLLIPLESALADSRPTVIPVDAAELRRAINLALGNGVSPLKSIPPKGRR